MFDLLTALRHPEAAEPGKRLGTDFPASQAPLPILSKWELVEKWFAEHPEDRERTGRDLERSVNPMGITVSYKTWNNVKKTLT